MIDQFADEYLSGRTPIPCVRCNMGVKFTDLFTLAKELGADCLATGHYVRRVMGPQGAELHRAVDPARDQSYFLFATTQDQLDFLRFPLGGLEKSVVREIARDLGPVSYTHLDVYKRQVHSFGQGVHIVGQVEKANDFRCFLFRRARCSAENMA